MNDTRLQELYQRMLDARNDAARTACVAPEDIQALVERHGSEEQRLTTLDHVMSCRECIGEFELMRALRRGAPVQWRWHPATLAIAASLIVAVAIGLVSLRTISERGDVMRGGPVGGGAVQLIAPATPATPGAPLVLRWHAVPNAMSYSVEVLTPNGTVVTSAVTPDTTAALPDSVHLSPGVRYLWWVRAHRADGSEQRSAMQPLSGGHGGSGEP